MNNHYEYVAILHLDGHIFIRNPLYVAIPTSKRPTFLYNVLSMTKNYTSTLQGLNLDRYVKKLQCLCGRVGEPNMSTLASVNLYQFPRTEWIDDILLWSLWTFQACAHTLLRYTLEKLKAHKSLEAYTIIRGLLP